MGITAFFLSQKSHFVKKIIRYPKFLVSKMKGLALAIVFGLSCFWCNTTGMRVNVNVDINPSNEPGVYGQNYPVVQERTRIVGGEEVEPYSIPWQAYLKIETTNGYSQDIVKADTRFMLECTMSETNYCLKTECMN